MRLAILTASLVTAPSLAHAAAEGGDLGGFLWSIFNLAVLVAVLVYFARKPIRDYFRDRRRRIAEELDASARLLRDAETRLAEWQARIEQLDAELVELRETSRMRSAADRERILAQARATAERIRGDAAAAVDQELTRARARLREEAASLAVELAAGILEKQVTAADRKRLLDDFIERVER
jgi:F-type H+-transporting ATPase subunit b